MHHTLTKTIKLFVSILFVLVVSGCFSRNAGINIIEKKYETDTAIVEVEIPEFKDFPDSTFMQELNLEYDKNINKCLEEFSIKSETENKRLKKCVFRITQEQKFSKMPLLSVIGEVYIYTDGIHGSNSRIAKNIDTAQNKVLKLSDLFSDDSFHDAINKEITNIIDKNPDEYHDLWENPILSSINEEFFYLSEHGLVIFYPPYELSYYARGFVEFCIPYENLSGYFKPEYRFL